MMQQAPNFQLEVDHNPYLAAGARVVDAILTVTAAEGTGAVVAAPSGSASMAQVIMVDCSGSMIGKKIVEARRAVASAVDTLRDGTPFAIVAGTDKAFMGYPSDMRLVPANAQTRAAAKSAVERLSAFGGTAIGSWLRLAGKLLATSDAEVKHGILLTDGDNLHETAAELDTVLAENTGSFTCDARGVGKEWKHEVLLKISSAMLGTVGGLEDPSHLAGDFRAMTENAMGKTLGNATLRVWSPAGARIRLVKQVTPTIEDLTDRVDQVNPRTGDYPIGAWGPGETRDFHVCLEIPVGEVGEAPRLATRLKITAGETTLAEHTVTVEWTDETTLFTEINPRVAHYTGQEELATAILQGVAAFKNDERELATEKLGRAVALATESDHTQALAALGKLVEIEDAPTGTVRLRSDAKSIDVEMAGVRSTTTVALRRRAEDDDATDA
ncbi:VWA domain-containing protein [Actinorhabdospora filicis]|uniref:VWA domain-containing protein n=1 Tax=Actinorhabdospora filicis TaxID=1785913 RepID=A0A9W6WBT2_9ACTN|nr:VWA domain-containing protein [Actinorhabdospora filicis]GLZ79040.1 VWA domain-containing protein [Actinorhabdospora filicis]